MKKEDNIEETIRRNQSDVGQYDGIEDEIDFIIDNVGYIHTPEYLTKKILKYMEEK